MANLAPDLGNPALIAAGPIDGQQCPPLPKTHDLSGKLFRLLNHRAPPNSVGMMPGGAARWARGVMGGNNGDQPLVTLGPVKIAVLVHYRRKQGHEVLAAN